MTSFYSEEELKGLGLKQYGTNVLISRHAGIYGADKIVIGNNVRIDDFCILSGHIEIGNYVHIAAYTALYGGTEGVFIDDFVGISSHISIYSVSDDYSGATMSNPMIPDKFKVVDSRPVHIGRHVLFGSSCVVLPGADVAEGCSVSSFAFINKPTEPWGIYGDIPAKRLKERKKDLLELEKQFLAEEEQRLAEAANGGHS